jgi:anti-anti-sigma regulatory factor/anti-sigma regulatory factor (Ser/Thr protein kinase)
LTWKLSARAAPGRRYRGRARANRRYGAVLVTVESVREALVCRTEWIASVAVVSLRGPLRIDTTPVLRAAVLKSLAAEPGAVIVDLAGLDELEDLAVTALAALARAAAAWPGIEVVVVAPDPAVRGRLSALAVSRFVPVAVDREAALELAGSGRRPAVARQTLPAGPAAVTAARAAVRDLCAERGLDKLIDTAEVIASELVSNAVVHARPPYLFTVHERGRYLHLSVRDATVAPPVRRGFDPLSGTGGRGLLLVESLATAWGMTPRDDGKVVWATLSLRAGAGIP